MALLALVACEGRNPQCAYGLRVDNADKAIAIYPFNIDSYQIVGTNPTTIEWVDKSGIGYTSGVIELRPGDQVACRVFEVAPHSR